MQYPLNFSYRIPVLLLATLSAALTLNAQLLPRLELAPDQVRYRNGRAYWQGDVIVGSESEIKQQFQQRKAQGLPELAVVPPTLLWPSATPGVGPAIVPYLIQSQSAPGSPARAFVDRALAEFNTLFAGVIQFVPRENAPAQLQANHVIIGIRELGFGTCSGSSGIGMRGGPQPLDFTVNPADCPVSILLHEMGHTIGLFHEQIRSDRDNFVNVNYRAIRRSAFSEYDKVPGTQTIGLYDWGSTMQYGRFLFSRDGVTPNIESIPPGISMRMNGAYSAGDVDTVRRLYGATPQAITVTSNPPGLRVTVDGTTITTPQTFTWAIGTTHTLDVPAGIQTTPDRSTFLFSGASQPSILGR